MNRRGNIRGNIRENATGYFSRSEWLRLASGLIFLAVLYQMMVIARQPSVWRFLVQEEELVPVPPPSPAAVPNDGPTDLDPDEREIAREHFQAITDKEKLTAEEMPVYWRMMRWARNQSFESLKGRARRDLLFAHLMERPEVHRGELIHLNLHLMRSLTYEVEENSAGLDRLYEVWGWTNESQPYPYVVVFPEWPEGMPLGADIREDAEVEAYFFKLLAYEARDDKRRAAPLLIGRLTWRKPATPELTKTDWWTIALVFGVGATLVALLQWRWFRLGDLPPSVLPNLAKPVTGDQFLASLDKDFDENFTVNVDTNSTPTHTHLSEGTTEKNPPSWPSDQGDRS